MNLLKSRGVGYQPDMVVLVYNLNDIEYLPDLADSTYNKSSVVPVLQVVGERNADKYNQKKGFRGFIYWFERRSVFVGLAVPRVGRVLRNMGLLNSLEFSWVEKIFSGYTDDNPGWLESKRALRGIQQICLDEGISLLVAIYPLLTSLDSYGGEQAHRTVRAYCEGLGIEVVDLFSIFEGKSSASFWVNHMDSHPNRTAHDMVATELLPILGDRLKVPGTSRAQR